MAFFSMKVCSVLLIIVIVVLIKEDIINKGSFEASNTGTFLRDVGLYNHTLKCYSWSNDLINQTKESIRTRFPDCYDKTVDILEPIASITADYVIATVVSTKKWCYIITHQHTRTYLPIVKDNIFYYYNEFKNGIQICKHNVPIYFETVWNIILQKIVLIWSPMKRFLEDNLSVTIDMEYIYEELKSVANTISEYIGDLYNRLIDLLNLERSL